MSGLQGVVSLRRLAVVGTPSDEGQLGEESDPFAEDIPSVATPAAPFPALAYVVAEYRHQVRQSG